MLWWRAPDAPTAQQVDLPSIPDAEAPTPRDFDPGPVPTADEEHPEAHTPQVQARVVLGEALGAGVVRCPFPGPGPQPARVMWGGSRDLPRNIEALTGPWGEGPEYSEAFDGVLEERGWISFLAPEGTTQADIQWPTDPPTRVTVTWPEPRPGEVVRCVAVPEARPVHDLSGTVVLNGAPVADASVVGCGGATRTGENGRFALSSSSGPCALVASWSLGARGGFSEPLEIDPATAGPMQLVLLEEPWLDVDGREEVRDAVFDDAEHDLVVALEVLEGVMGESAAVAPILDRMYRSRVSELQQLRDQR